MTKDTDLEPLGPRPPRVWHYRDRDLTPDVWERAVYVGRPSKWGNPFQIGIDGDRAQVMHLYRNWVMVEGTEEWRAMVRRELGGKDLICWCAPKACHADILLEIANGTD